ncbi:UbiX family flavin prenyltransferase [Mycolicibacterium hodleri]|uniref:Flavin prenyltransferase UbiX n=1 Tax=Mycolicibacterium hodleri TaxID=49897 RepID=A0A502EAB5_9MYCO|nr:UbiX family flavin prenyltransferase [Mycolicibacterium hodleri]TPG34317.1 UbiX family flavin prenyltransferase [Mycolicibacterium hodleri]
MTTRLIIGVSGATGIVYAQRLLETLCETDVETHLVVTKAAEMTAAYEGVPVQELKRLADETYPIGDVGAAIASGSFKTIGMIVAPCSMRSLAEIATGTTTNLLTRAADVCLKERRRLVLMTRETPLHAGHLKAMLAVTDNGGIIAPPVPAFYTKPTTLGDLVDHTVGRVLDLFDIDTPLVTRWTGEPPRHGHPAVVSLPRKVGRDALR